MEIEHGYSKKRQLHYTAGIINNISLVDGYLGHVVFSVENKDNTGLVMSRLNKYIKKLDNEMKPITSRAFFDKVLSNGDKYHEPTK